MAGWYLRRARKDSVGGLSKLAAFSLTATAAAPVGAVWLCTYYGKWDVSWWPFVPPFDPAIAVALGLLIVLGIVCRVLLTTGRAKLERKELDVESVGTRDGEIVGFLVAYAMPMLAGTPSFEVAPLIAFSLFLVLALWHTQVVHVNPVASLFGYHFYRVIERDTGAEYLLVSRRWSVAKGTLDVVRLSRGLWLDRAESNP